MESLSLSAVLSAPFPLQNHPKTPKLVNLHRPNSAIARKLPPLNRSHSPVTSRTQSRVPPLLPLSLINLFNGALPCFAADTILSSSSSSGPDPSARINLEAILVSIDDFFNRNPFFVAGCTFIWLVVIPVAEYYLKKYKYVLAIDAFRKLRDDPTAQLLDIRDRKSSAATPPPSLGYMMKRPVQVPFDEGDEDGFVNKVKESFGDPSDTVICILDSFDGNSMRVAELLFKNGFKEAYAIKDGVRGKKGWLAIQETLLPPSVHMFPKKKGKASEDLGTNGAVAKQSGRNSSLSSSPSLPTKAESQASNPGMKLDSNKSKVSMVPDNVVCSSSSSPYPNYPDLKPPSSPTPAKPKN
ncbi:rhodanese-like domain-containing protein 4A, chloroplastic [Punica granatum]|nr:rhodanese-like domain-containing protein 4A, chloroplastic [Punica granatum]